MIPYNQFFNAEGQVKKYKIVKPVDAGSGYLRKGDGTMVSMTELAPKVGDVITGSIEESFVFNKKLRGITYDISTDLDESKIFIPEGSVVEVTPKNETPDTPRTPKKQRKGNPFAQGYKKYVVTQEFTANSVDNPNKNRKFKIGTNLFAKDTILSSKEGIGANLTLVSYAGFIIDKTKVAEKNKNIFEKVQSFFTVKKGFA